MSEKFNHIMEQTEKLKRFALIFLTGIFLIFTPLYVAAQSIPEGAFSPGKALELRAAAMLRLGRHAEAIDLYMQALYKNPRNSSVYHQLSQLLPGKENASTLLQIVEDILKSQPEDNRLLAEKGRLLYLLEKREDAIQLWEQIIEQRKKDRFIYTTVTNAMLKAGAFDEAIDVLIRGRSNLGSQNMFTYDLARIYSSKHNYAMATAEYLSHLDQNPRMLDPIANQLINLIKNDGALEAIELGFDEILATEGQHISILLARAKLLLHEKRYEACAQTLLTMEAETSMKEILSIANDLKNEKAWLPAAEVFLFISSNSKDNNLRGEALLNLATTYERQLDVKKSYQSLAAFFPGNPFFELDLRIMPVENTSLERTLKLYDSLQIVLPQTREAYMASFHIAELNLTTSGDVDRAIRGFKTIFESSPYADLRKMAGKRLVEAHLSKGDTTAATKALEQAIHTLALDEDNPTIIASRIKIMIHQGDVATLIRELKNLSGAALPSNPLFNDGMELQALLESNGGVNDPRLIEYLKAERLIGQHKLSEAIEVLLGMNGPPSSIADEASVRAMQLLMILGETDRAQIEMDRFLQHDLDSPWRSTVLIWRGEQFQFVNGDTQAAIPYYEELIINHPEYLGTQAVRLRLRDILGAGS